MGQSSSNIEETKSVVKVQKNETEMNTTQNISVNLLQKEKQKLILKRFENALLSKDTQNVMGIIEKYGNDVNLFEYYKGNGDTCLQYAVRIHDIKLLYYLLQKNIDVCLYVLLYLCLVKAYT